MTALTGETGAGKTLLVEALELLVGGRAEPGLVRAGADRGTGRGPVRRRRRRDGDPAPGRTRTGRSRAWIDGRMAPVAALAELAGALLDLHGQHAHQSLLDTAAQRRALDAFGGIDLDPVDELRQRAGRRLEAAARRARRRRPEPGPARPTCSRYQLGEIDAAGLADPDEDERSGRRGGPPGRRWRPTASGRGRWPLAALDGRATAAGGAVDLLGAAAGALDGRSRASARSPSACAPLQAEVADIATELRGVVETWEDDPAAPRGDPGPPPAACRAVPQVRGRSRRRPRLRRRRPGGGSAELESAERQAAALEASSPAAAGRAGGRPRRRRRDRGEAPRPGSRSAVEERLRRPGHAAAPGSRSTVAEPMPATT